MKKTKKKVVSKSKKVKAKSERDMSLENVSWDDLASELIDLEIELYLFRDEMKSKEVKVFELLIESCEMEKGKRIKEQCEGRFCQTALKYQ